MKKNFQIEYHKIKSYIPFWLIVGLFAGLYLLVLFVASNVNINVQGLDSRNFIKFPYIWNTATWIAKWFNLLFVLLIIILVSNEFTYKTYRQHIIDGLYRNELVFGKLIIITILSIFSFAFVFILSMIFGSIFSDKIIAGDIVKRLYYVVFYLIQIFGYMSFALLIATLMRSTALSIVVYLGYYFLESILKLYFFILKLPVAKYFPLEILSSLTPSPNLADAASDAKVQQSIEHSMSNISGQAIALEINVILAIVYISIFVWLSFYIVKKRNL